MYDMMTEIPLGEERREEGREKEKEDSVILSVGVCLTVNNNFKTMLPSVT